MSSYPVKKTLTAAFAACFIFGAVSTALAVPPRMFSYQFHSTENVIGDCGDFEIWNDVNLVLDLVTHLNQDGDRTFTRQHWRVSDSVYYRSDDPSVFVYGGPGEQDIRKYDWLDEVWAYSGPAFKITIPGYGVIFHEAGHAIYDPANDELTFQRGPSDFTDGDFDALCMALNP